MKKTYYIVLLVLCLLPSLSQAQSETDEITVTDENGAEEVIDVPEGMAQSVDSLMQEFYAEKYLQRDASCNYKDENRTYDKEVYIERLSRLPNIMEMPYNDVVKKFIDRYTERLRRSVSLMLGSSNFYMPVFEEALDAYNVPLELKYLPVIESALNPRATSRVGAAGLWQFMVGTAKQYGLEVNSMVDERRDIVKSSYAAARYLSDLYKIFGDWNLVIAAYNCGPENIRKAIHRSNGSSDYWKIYSCLPRETRGYVPAFIAANYVMNYYCEHNICPMRTKLPVTTDTVVVSKDVHFKQISEVCGIGMEELKALNPQYRRDIVNGSSKPSAIRLPSAMINTFLTQEDSIYNFRQDELLTRRSVVEVSEEAQGDYPNYSRKSSRSHQKSLRGGKRGRKGKSRSGRGKNVTIKQGQTLSEIAERNHTTVSKLKKLNGIKGSNIRAGRKLKVK